MQRFSSPLPAPFQSSKKLYLVRTADAHGKAAPGDKDKSGEQVLSAKVNSSDKYISAEHNLNLFPILGCLWGRCSYWYMLLLKIVHAPLTCFRAWLARDKRGTCPQCACRAVRGHPRKMLSRECTENFSHSCCLQICPGQSPVRQTPLQWGVIPPHWLGFRLCTMKRWERALESLSLFAGQLSPESPHASCIRSSCTGGHAESNPEVPRGGLPCGY